MTTFSYDGTVIQTDTIAQDGYYDITAEGAQGGGESQFGTSGGLGASATARVFLTSGTVLDILVGGHGLDGAGGTSGGGGGGSFVVEEQPTANLALVVGGGGGGAGSSGGSTGGAGGLTGSSDQGGGADDSAGAGGGGFATDGASSNGGATGGASFEDGGAGGHGIPDYFGHASGHEGFGGFGGGGGGGLTGGGGGGYGGGASGADDFIPAADSGSGGTSFVTASAISDSVFSGVESGDGLVTINLVCYAQGTTILTDRGYRPVETLAIGDCVVTASGAVRPIRWIGHRRVDCRAHVPAVEAQPIRIAAHAFGRERPARDLFVSPGHAICVDLLGEFFIPAHALLNGSTIVQMDVETVTYWHVELDSHDILLADNLPCESYCDHGNRDFFVETGVVSLTAKPDGEWRADAPPAFCRPFHERGPLVEAARAQLQRRAEAMGWRIAPCALDGFHALVGGRRLDPELDGLVARFVLPPGADDVWLIAPTARPFDISDSLDKRDLGVRVSRLSLDGVAIPLDDPRLTAGFHHMERDWRWTSGRALLPKSLMTASGESALTVELCAPPLPRWSPPSAISAAAAPDLMTA